MNVHKKAYLYTHEYTKGSAVHCSTRIIALTAKAPDISAVMNVLNDKIQGVFTVQKELDVSKAVHKRSLTGSSIAQDWRLLDTALWHSIEISNTVLI